MITTNLKLNDFAFFDQLIFNNAQPDWRSRARYYYNENSKTIDIPIDHYPQTIAEYQFCHYVLWMTIYAEKLWYKPCPTYNGGKCMPIDSFCFACGYANDKHTGRCPIKIWQPVCCCADVGSLYRTWVDFCSDETAYDIAHLEWTEDD